MGAGVECPERRREHDEREGYRRCDQAPDSIADGHTFTLSGYGVNRSVSLLATITVSLTANKTGVFPFRCEFHKPWMGGELVVLPAR